MSNMLKKLMNFRYCLVGLIAFTIQPTTSNGQELAQYHLIGVNEFEASSLLQYAAHAAISQNQISGEHIARIVERLYHEDGYFLARARFDNDLQAVIVDEGQISSLHVEGVDADMFALIRSYAAPLLTDPAISHAEIERVLMLVRDIETITAVVELVTSPDDGTTQMRIIAEEHLSNWGRLTLDTPAQNIDDAIRINLEQNYYHAATAGDLLRLNVQGIDNLDNGNNKFSGSLAYRTPAGPAGGYLEAYVGTYTARHDARGTLSSVDNSGSTAILAYGFPTLRTSDRYGYLIGELRHTQTDIGSPLVNSDESVVVGSLIWIDGQIAATGNAVEYALSLSAGQQSDDPLSASNFHYARVGLGWNTSTALVRREMNISLQLLGQLSNDVLPGSENFVMGGQNINRGYNYGEFAGDSGFVISGKVSAVETTGFGRNFTLMPFAVAEIGWAASNTYSERFARSEEGASIGIGFDFNLLSKQSGRFYAALPLIDGPVSRDDPTFYLSISKTW